jgi:hypothetical protein
MAAGSSSYGMTDTMGLIGMGNNPMVGATVAVSVVDEEAMRAKPVFKPGRALK